MKWPKAMRCLGIFVGHDKEKNEKLNWLDKIDKIRQLILSWSKRDLSIYGKMQTAARRNIHISLVVALV